MGTPNKNSPSIVPKISQKLAYRTLAMIVAVGALVYGLEWFLKVRSDIEGLKTTNTAGWISALEYLPEGQRAVLISPDHKVHEDTGYKANSVDRELTWSPHGNFLYFVSDRADKAFNLYRWSPEDPDAKQRTTGTRSRDSLRFPAQVTDDADNAAKGLIVTGGLVQELDPSTGASIQVLPPSSKEITTTQSGDESGTTSGQFEGVYGNLGTSFREAAWCGDKKYIAAVMRREAGEILIVQEMQVDADGKFPPPRPIMAGDKVEFAINPKDGNIVFTVSAFQWAEAPTMDANGHAQKKPFVNGVGVFDLTKHAVAMITGGNNELMFGAPAVSNDGTQIALVVSRQVKDEVVPLGLWTLPTERRTDFKPLQFPGDIHEPSWSADGKTILAAVRTPGGKRAIVEIPIDQSAPINITGDAGNFGFPQYSPQKSGG